MTVDTNVNDGSLHGKTAWRVEDGGVITIAERVVEAKKEKWYRKQERQHGDTVKEVSPLIASLVTFANKGKFISSSK
jgi:hypothetical protein